MSAGIETRHEEAAWNGYQQWVVELEDGKAYYEIVEPDGTIFPVGPPLRRDLLLPGSVEFLRGWASQRVFEKYSGGESMK